MPESLRSERPKRGAGGTQNRSQARNEHWEAELRQPGNDVEVKPGNLNFLLGVKTDLIYP